MRPTFLAFFLSGLLPAMAWAQWGTTFRGGLFGNFSAEDWDLFKKSIQQAIDAPPESGPVAWSNTRSTARGDAHVESRFERQDLGECRQVKGQATAKGLTAPFDVVLCRQSPNESWRLLSASPR